MLPRNPRLRHAFICVFVGLLVLAGGRSSPGNTPGELQPTGFAVGGCGGAYFLAEQGELTIDLYKRDLNRSDRTTELRAILVGPDRQVLAESVIPDDGTVRGQPGPWQQIRLKAQVGRPGVFGLNITVSQDRYGDQIAWGFSTNCRKYLIETSRGHRDERHREPIVLRNPGRLGKVCFRPPHRAFSIELADLPAEVSEVILADANQKTLCSMKTKADGTATANIPADLPRTAPSPWQLLFPSQQATVHIDGVTQWQSSDRFNDLACWTPDPESYFPLLDYRWLLTPYHRNVHGIADQPCTAEFTLHNNSDRETEIQLQVEYPQSPWGVHLSADRVTLLPGHAKTVTASFVSPPQGQQQVCHLRATTVNGPEFSTYSTLVARSDQPLASRRLEMPIMLQAYRHENELFGYLPDYPTENQVYFDLHNRPFIRADGCVATFRQGEWHSPSLGEAIRYRDPKLEATNCWMTSSKVAFDSDNDLYVLGSAGSQSVLFRSSDGGQSFAAYVIPGREGQPRTFDIEQPSGHNTPEGPPPILRYTRTAVDPRLRWRRVNDLELILPEKREGQIVFGKPILITKNCIGLSAHSGIPSSVVSRGSKVHVAWGEATEPGAPVPGVPACVATYDRQTRQLSEPAVVGYGPPANDVHNSPSITMDSQGYLHVLCGTHGQPFPYARSLKPNDAAGGWTEPEPIGAGARQTYIGFVCGQDDTLYTAFRMWRYGEPPHPLSHHATLAFQRKRPGKSWEPPRVLVVAPFSEYSIFYHRLTIDRRDRLFLSYDYWSTYWFYRMDHRGNRRALLMSPDGGNTWKLAQTADLKQE